MLRRANTSAMKGCKFGLHWPALTTTATGLGSRYAHCFRSAWKTFFGCRAIVHTSYTFILLQRVTAEGTPQVTTICKRDGRTWVPRDIMEPKDETWKRNIIGKVTEVRWLQILIFYFESEPTLCFVADHLFFCSFKFHKIIFFKCKRNIFLARIIVLFNLKTCHTALKTMGLGSRIRKKPLPDPGYRIHGSKRPRIPISNTIDRCRDVILCKLLKHIRW
jgi:hypothetical protein